MNEAMFKRASDTAKTEGRVMRSETVDLNFITIEPKRYDLIFAHATTHHAIRLFFEQIMGGRTGIGVLAGEVPRTR